MPETATKEENKIEKVFDDVKVTRNGVDLTFDEHRIKRGKNAAEAKPYLAPNEEIDNDVLLKFTGTDVLAQLARSFWRRMCQSYIENSLDEVTGQLDIGKFTNLAASASVMGETIKVLRGRLEDLQSELTKIPMAEYPILMNLPEHDPKKKKFIDLMQRISAVSLAMEKKKKVRTEDEEEQNAEPVSAV